MRKSISAVLIVAGLLVVGCTRDDQLKRDHDKLDKMAATQSASADACTHCDGTQLAKSDGTCPACGMKVR